MLRFTSSQSKNVTFWNLKKFARNGLEGPKMQPQRPSLICTIEPAVLWIQIHWIRIRNCCSIWIPIQSYVINLERKFKKIMVDKNNQLKISYFKTIIETMALEELFSQLSLWKVNLLVTSCTFCGCNLSYLPVWIRIRIRIRIHQGPEHGSSLDPDPQHRAHVRVWLINRAKDIRRDGSTNRASEGQMNTQFHKQTYCR